MNLLYIIEEYFKEPKLISGRSQEQVGLSFTLGIQDIKMTTDADVIYRIITVAVLYIRTKS
jgi:hypothetical protein